MQTGSFDSAFANSRECCAQDDKRGKQVIRLGGEASPALRVADLEIGASDPGSSVPLG
jgi:hypothetical protein